MKTNEAPAEAFRPYARRPRPVRRRSWRGRVFGLLGAAVCFALGLALGQTIEDRPEPGGTITQIRTLAPGTVAPTPETVTVTVSSP